MSPHSYFYFKALSMFQGVVHMFQDVAHMFQVVVHMFHDLKHKIPLDKKHLSLVMPQSLYGTFVHGAERGDDHAFLSYSFV